MKIKNNDYEQEMSLYITIANIVILILLFVMCLDKSIWSDEAYDLRMITNPYSYFLLSFRDAAPPFHFFIMKVFVDTAKVILPGVNYIYVAKMCSLVPYIFIFVLSHTFVVRRWGKLTGALCGMLSITMPMMFVFGIEMRQYSWSVLLAFLWFLAFCDYVEKETVAKAIAITILGPISLMSHYFIVFGIVYAYVFYCIYSLIKKSYRGVLILCGVSFGSCLLFLPWIFLAFGGVLKSAKKFWIPKITISDIGGALIFPFRPDVSKWPIEVLGTLLMFTVLVYLIIRLKEGEYSSAKVISYIGITMPFAVAVVGLFIGAFVFPVFQPRYIMPIMACCWLGVSIAIANYVDIPKIKIAIIAFLMCIALLNVAKHTKDEVAYKKNIDILIEFLEGVEHKDMIQFAVDDDHLRGCLPFYTDEAFYSINWFEEDYGMVVDSALAGNDMYLFHSTYYKTDASYIDDMKAQGIVMDKIVDCGIEYVDLEIYLLHK